METVSERIRKLRGATSRAAIKRATGIPTSSLQALEERPTTEASRHFPALAKFWGVNEEWLRTGRGPRAISDPQRHTAITADELAERPLSIQEIARHTSRIVRLDPAMLRAGFITVSNYFTACGGEFKTPDDLDLLAKAYDCYASFDQQLIDWIYAEIERRTTERGVINEAEKRKVDHRTQKHK